MPDEDNKETPETPEEPPKEEESKKNKEPLTCDSLSFWAKRSAAKNLNSCYLNMIVGSHSRLAIILPIPKPASSFVFHHPYILYVPLSDNTSLTFHLPLLLVTAPTTNRCGDLSSKRPITLLRPIHQYW